MASSAPTRESLDKSRRLLKRDHNRIVEEINKLIKQSTTLEIVEQLEALKVSLLTTKAKLDDMYFDYMSVLDLTDQTDSKLDEELMKDRDTQFLNIDRAVGVCNAARRKFEGASKRDSLNASVMSDSAPASSAKLPKISVPTFSGDYRKFLDFKALYENLVHNDDNIPPVRKMHYLKESLTGEASSTLANLSVSDEGYKEAWSRVINKYDNKRLIIHTHFNDLFGAEKLKSDQNLRLLVDRFDNAMRGFRICNQTPDMWSPILAYMLYTKLDNKTRTDYDNINTENASYLSYKGLFKFCDNRAHNIEARKFEDSPAATSIAPKSSQSAQKDKAESKRTSFLAAKSGCVACKEQHLLIECPKFKSLSPAERFQLIKSSKMCVNCYSRSHTSSACKSAKRCKLCAKMHHTMLHIAETPNTNPVPLQSAQPSQNGPPSVDAKTVSATESKFTSNVTGPIQQKSFIVLPSAVVKFQCGKFNGIARILLDDCSQPTLISDLMVRKFKLPTSRNLSVDPIHGVGFDDVQTSRVCSLKLGSRINSFEINIQAEVIPASAIRYAVNSVSWSKCPEQFKELKGLNLADPAFYSASPNIERIDILLGAEFSELCKLNETTQIENLVLRNTQFGWTLIGKFPVGQSNEKACFMTTNTATYVPDIDACAAIVNIDAQLSRFWEIENVMPIQQ